MRRAIITAAVLAFSLSASAAPVLAAPCKDARGRFIRCPPPRPMMVRCKDARGKFAKCGLPGVRPA